MNSYTEVKKAALPPKQTLDPYRPLANQIKKHLSSYAPTSGDSPSLGALLNIDKATYEQRVQDKVLSLDPSGTGPSPASQLVKGKKRHRGDPGALAAVREAAQSKRKERERLGIVGVRKVQKAIPTGAKVSYTSLLPLHYLHTSYFISLLNLPSLPTTLPNPLPPLPPSLSAETIQSKLSKADLPGAHLTLLSSRNTSLPPISGICLSETSSTFQILSPDDKTRVIPKNGCLFRITLPAYAPMGNGAKGDDGEVKDGVDWEGFLRECPRVEVDLLGGNFGFRSGDRAGRKFRAGQGGGGGSGWGEEWVRGEWQGILGTMEVGEQGRVGGYEGGKTKRKRGKARRKDPLAGGRD